MRRVVPLIACLLSALPSAALAQSKAYVTNQSFNQVNVFRTSDWVSLGSIPVGLSPTDIAIPASGGFALVTNRGGNSVSRINLANNAVTTVAVPGGPTAVAIRADGAKAYVVQSTNCPPQPTPTPAPTPGPGSPTPPPPTPTPVPACEVAVLDTTTNPPTLIKEITVGHQPFDVAVSGGIAYVTNRTDGTLSVIDTSSDTVVDEVPAGSTPKGIAVGAGEIYVANDVPDTVTVIREIDLQMIATIPVGASPLAVAVSPNGLKAIAGSDTGASVSIITTGVNTTGAPVAVGTNPAGITFTPDSTQAIVANSTGSSISVVTISGGVLKVPVTGSPTSVAITPAPVFSLVKVANAPQVSTGSTVTYTLSFTNIGNGTASGLTITDPIPTGLSFASATDGGAPSGGNVVWNLPNLDPGVSGVVQVTFNVSGALDDGTPIANIATISATGATPVQSEADIRARTPKSLDLTALYRKDPPSARPKDLVRFRTAFPMPPTFDGSGPVNITVASPNNGSPLFQFTVPAGQLSNARKRYSYRGKLGVGRVALTLSRDSKVPGQWRARFFATKQSLPLINAPLPPQISFTINLNTPDPGDTDTFFTERVFDVKRSRPGGQKFVYSD